MKMKCVGGPHDGEWRDVRDGDKNVILNRSTSPPVSISDPPETWSDSVTIEQSHYTVRYICGTHERERDAMTGHRVPHRVVEFLAPVEWTDEQAIRHQFSK